MQYIIPPQQSLLFALESCEESQSHQTVVSDTIGLHFSTAFEMLTTVTFGSVNGAGQTADSINP